MMNKINQADIAASLGEEEVAADIMEQLAEELRESQAGQSQQNPLAQKFQALMQQLGNLIEKEGALLKDLQDSLTSHQKNQLSWKQKIQNQKIASSKTEAFKEYHKFTKELQNPKLTKEEQQNLMKRLGNPEDLAYQGIRLTEMFRKIDSLSKKPESSSQLTPQLKGLNKTLPENLRWPDELLTPPKEAQSLNLDPITSGQKQLSPEGKSFADDFRASLSPVIPSESFLD